MAKSRVTILDVAAAAGVSRQTVTRAMNNMGDISAETRAKVLAASEKLDYRPSRFASNLARQKHHAVGLVLRDLRNPFYADLAVDVLEVFAESGWQTVIATNDGSHDDEATLARLRSQVDVIVGYFEAGENAIARAARGVPVVLFERQATVPGLHSVLLDFESGVAGLIPQLKVRGSRQFGMIDSRSSNPSAAYVPTPRRLMFEKYVDSRSRKRVVAAPETLTGAAEGFDDLLRRYPGVDTVIVFNDLMALGALQAAHAQQLAIPDQVRIVGIDGLSLGEVMFPPLTTLALDRRAMAAAASSMARALIAQEQAAPTTSIVLPRPIWRASA